MKWRLLIWSLVLIYLTTSSEIMLAGYKQVELTEEQVLKRQQRAKKRRLEAHEKREKDKVCQMYFNWW